jgi:hypothetical protein
MRKAVAVTTLLVALLTLVDRVDPVREGLNGTYYANTSWSNPPAVSTLDAQLTNDNITAAWRGAPPPGFSATWAGSLLVMHDGPYTLATISADGSSVYVDGQAVVDNAGARTWPRGVSGTIALTRGVHAIYVRYARESGPFHLDFLWARAGEPLERVPGWALTPRRTSFEAFALSAALRQSLAGAEWLWAATLMIGALTFAWSRLMKVRTWLEREQVWPALRWILAASLILNVAGIWWGLPGGSWAPDELSPVLVMEGAARWFAHGWFDRYPPFHFYVLTVAFSPLLFLQWLGRIDLSTAAPYALLALISRLVSVAAAVGTLVAVYGCGAQTFGRRAGIFAAATFSLVSPFVYYAKTANLDAPYLFWFGVSLLFYLRLLDTLALRDFIGFAASATIAICTKDQAYGLYLLTPVAIVHRMWRANRDAGIRAPLTRAVLDARLRWAAAVALVLFAACHNLPLNASGFAEHVRYITGGGSETYRDFEPTLAGRAALLRLTVDVVRAALGWPMFLVAAAGVVLALLTPSLRRPAVWLTLPAASYYFGFVNVVLYNYDRFMLPVCLVLSLFAGLAFDRWLSPGGRGHAWRAAAGGLVFASTMLYAATVDLAMLRDSRYTVEQWLAARVEPTDTVAFVFPRQYYPRLERFNSHEVTSTDQLERERPSYYILNADYGTAEPADSQIGRLIAGLQNGDLGYRLVFRFRAPAPWPWMPGAPRELVGPRNERPITSVLRHINPRYEVFKRTS